MNILTLVGCLLLVLLSWLLSIFWKSGQETFARLHDLLDDGSLLCSMVAPIGRSGEGMGQRRQWGEWKLIGAHRNYFNWGKEVAFGSSCLIWNHFSQRRREFPPFCNRSRAEVQEFKCQAGLSVYFWYLRRSATPSPSATGKRRALLSFPFAFHDFKRRKKSPQTGCWIERKGSWMRHYYTVVNFCSGRWKRQQVDVRWVLSTIWKRAASQLLSV